jgi:hypothetical protein
MDATDSSFGFVNIDKASSPIATTHNPQFKFKQSTDPFCSLHHMIVHICHRHYYIKLELGCC